MNSLREEKTYSDAGAWSSVDFSEINEKIASHQVSILKEENEDQRSLKELITYGLKGMAAYTRHAKVLGYEDEGVCLLYTSPSPRDGLLSRMPSSA